MMRHDRRTSTDGRRARAWWRGRFTSAALSACAALACAALGCAAPARPEGVVVYASGADLEGGNPLVTVHPLSRQVQRYALFVTLARYDSALAPQPYFARRWSWSGDRRVLTMQLAPDLRWHDGARTTARDVGFTLDAARDPATGYPLSAALASLTAIDAPDDTTVVLRFANPQPALPGVLCELPIVPAHRLRDVPRGAMRRDPFHAAPLGNGPFRLTSRERGARWVFERDSAFPASLGGPASLRRFVVAVVDEPATKLAGLVSGELDAAGISPTSADVVAADPTLRVLSYPVLFSTALVFNVGRPPFDDARVRRAFSLALQRRRIVDAALAGHASPATTVVPRESPLAVPGLLSENPATADSLLDAAGWRRGPDGRRRRDSRRLQVTLLSVGSGDNAIEQLVQADLAARGVRLDVRTLELGAFLAAARATPRSFDLLLTGIPGDLSLSHLAAMFDSRLAGGSLDYAGYHRAALDSLFRAVTTASTDSARTDAWQRVQRELAAEMPAAWVYHSRGVQGLSRRLEGVTMDLRGELVTLHRWRRASHAVLRADVARGRP